MGTHPSGASLIFTLTLTLTLIHKHAHTLALALTLIPTLTASGWAHIREVPLEGSPRDCTQARRWCSSINRGAPSRRSTNG
jgi:hypothetical protein